MCGTHLRGGGSLEELKQLLALASHQLSEHTSVDEDISFAKANVEAALAMIVNSLKTHEYDPDY